MKLSYKELKILEDALQFRFFPYWNLEVNELRIRISQEISRMEHEPNKSLDWNGGIKSEQSNFNR